VKLIIPGTSPAKGQMIGVRAKKWPGLFLQVIDSMLFIYMAKYLKEEEPSQIIHP
jgi:hypothetical protein